MEVVVTISILPELITLHCLLAYLETYGNHHNFNSTHERVPPPLIYTYVKGTIFIKIIIDYTKNISYWNTISRDFVVLCKFYNTFNLTKIHMLVTSHLAS